ncbi:hypothetical protein QYM41_08215 [Kocuria sp. CPCC 205268]|uniref:hypothetical protein n=1 Tax=Kocuria oxytropis TaxID=3058913 RepID=UPI0034D5228F
MARRWEDVNLGNSPVTATVTGTVVRTPGCLVRQVRPRTAVGHRTTSLPRFAADVLLRLSVVEEAHHRDLVFPSSTGTLREVNTVERR